MDLLFIQSDESEEGAEGKSEKGGREILKVSELNMVTIDKKYQHGLTEVYANVNRRVQGNVEVERETLSDAGLVWA